MTYLGCFNRYLVLLALFSGVSEVLATVKRISFLFSPQAARNAEHALRIEHFFPKVVSRWLSSALCFIHDARSEKRMAFSC